MARWRRAIGIGLLAIVALLAAGITATIGWRPFFGPARRPLTDRRFESTPERLERGQYMVDHLTGCFGCHSENDWDNHTLPREGRVGVGRSFAEDGAPWIVSSNITPDLETGAGGWSDDALARAIREGIGHDDRALFPMMPYQAYRHMSDEDLASIIVYLRTVKPVRNVPGKTQPPFPLNRFINLVPEPLTAPVPPPDVSTPEKRGEYLVRIADCRGCHTPLDAQGAPVPNLDFAGGNSFYPPSGQVSSANITQDPSGIPYYNESLFVQVLRTGVVVERKLSDAMPWAYYRGLTDEDLKAMYLYLKTVTPANHSVDNSLPPTDCKLCGLKHGGGERNVAPPGS